MTLIRALALMALLNVAANELGYAKPVDRRQARSIYNVWLAAALLERSLRRKEDR